uniref:Coiled-coil domain-containing protein 132 n=1 Tax=Wuchereria bancrofti TaxID=6293 RepID=A0AAF5PRY2_WUCBA
MKKSNSVQLCRNEEDETTMDSIDNIIVVRDSSGRGSAKSMILQTALPITDPVKETEILESIDAAYFIDEGFDATDYELKKVMGADILPEDLTGEMDKLKQQLQVVSKRVSEVIMQDWPSYSSQLEDIAEIQKDLNSILLVVQNIRKKLAQAKLENQNGLEIIANYRNRVFLKKLLSSLEDIKTLYEVQFQIKDLVQEENFPAAINMCYEAQKATVTFNQFSCVKELSTKLHETLEEIEINLDNCLASITILFSVDRYSSIYTAYKLLGKVEECGMKVVGFTRATLESSARTVIIDKILPIKTEAKIEELSYEQLCEAVDMGQILDCVRELGFVICKVLFTYHSILFFHIDEDERLECAHEKTENMGIVRKILVDSLYSIFKTASVKFSTLLYCHDLSLLKIDQFLDIIEMSNRFKQFGRTYFGNICGEVTMSLEKQSHQYFKRFHYDRMDELRMFLENEAFALCPVPLQFTLFDFQEFSFLKESNGCRGLDSSSHSKIDLDLGEPLDFQILQPTDVNPFLVGATDMDSSAKDVDITVISSAKNPSNDDVDSDRYRVDGSFSQLAPILCNASLNLLRFIGKYIRMAYVLHSVADQAVNGIFELCSYFFFAVYSFFVSNAHNVAESFFSPNLKNVVDNLENDLFSDDSSSEGASKFKCFPCTLLQDVKLDSAPSYALRERIVGAESVNFISKQLDLIRPVIESLVNRDVIEKYYAEILAVIPKMRECIYACAISCLIDYDWFVNDIVTTKWDICQLQSQHSTYVDNILQEFSRINDLLSEIAKQIPITRSVQKTFWSIVIYCTFNALVKGYGEFGKKCSNEGRALMQLDFQQLIAKLEQLVDFMPIPYKAYVENYIKAYYLPESSMESWILQHREYTTNQIITLLNVATHISKKARTRIINALEE